MHLLLHSSLLCIAQCTWLSNPPYQITIYQQNCRFWPCKICFPAFCNTKIDDWYSNGCNMRLILQWLAQVMLLWCFQVLQPWWVKYLYYILFKLDTTTAAAMLIKNIDYYYYFLFVLALVLAVLVLASISALALVMVSTLIICSFLLFICVLFISLLF